MEILKSIQEGLRNNPADALVTPTEKPYNQREEFHITQVDSQYSKELGNWFRQYEAVYAEQSRDREVVLKRPKPEAVAGSVPVTAPSGPGWVIQLEGYHYFNGADKGGAEGATHIRKFLIEHLEFGEVELPGPNGEPTKYTLKELGVSFPLISKPVSTDSLHTLPNPDFPRDTPAATGGASNLATRESSGAASSGGSSGNIEYALDANGKKIPSAFPAPKCTFIVEFAWQEKTLSDRSWWRKQEGKYDRFAIPPKQQANVAAAPSP